jgi:RNA polymerase sigma-70 factor (ECF subfamily)
VIIAVVSKMSTPAGDDPSLDIGELYDRHGAMVLRRVRRFYRGDEADEVLQEIFLRLLTTKASFRGEAAVTTWLYQVTTRHCLNRLRNARRRRELLDEHGAPAWGTPIAPPRQEARVFLEQLWSTLDEELVLIGVYAYVDGLSHAAIAELLGVSRRTVGNRLQTLAELVQAASEPSAGATGDPT